MSSRTACPHCGMILETPTAIAGKTVACPSCKGQFRLPLAGPPPIPVPRIEFDSAPTSPHPLQEEVETASHGAAIRDSIRNILKSQISIWEVLLVAVPLVIALISFLDTLTTTAPSADRTSPLIRGCCFSIITVATTVLVLWWRLNKARRQGQRAEERRQRELAEGSELKRSLAIEPRTALRADICRQLIAFDAHLKTTFTTTIFPADNYVGLLAQLSLSLAELDAERVCPTFVRLAQRACDNFADVCRLLQTFPRNGQAIIGGGFGLIGMAEGMAIASAANWLINSSVRGKQQAVNMQIDEHLRQAHHALSLLIEVG